MTDTRIESVSRETRVFPPPEEFAAKAAIGSREQYEALYKRSIDDPDGFWREQAEQLHWFEAPKTILDWKPPHAKWFVGGTTNLAYNCLDRHLTGARRNKAALIWEGEPGEVQVFRRAVVP